ncbi:LptF/LptG family permease [Luteolibacter sp. Populi]|uniref:LptF/LptG family permease n=1 Tax=Luteolibacter sp. Populi TaxID=3230487 RepID=UPI003466E188
MRLSDRYIGRQVLVGTVFAIFLLSTILMMGSLFQKLRPLLVEAGAPLSIVPELIAAVVPFSLIYTIPWAFLSAVLLVFGRLSSDQELTGFHIAGISLTRLSAPVFAIGVALSALCLWLNVKVAPVSNQQIERIFIHAFLKDPKRMLRAAAQQDGLERLESSAKDVRVYLDESDGTNIKGLHIFKIADPKAKEAKEKKAKEQAAKDLDPKAQEAKAQSSQTKTPKEKDSTDGKKKEDDDNDTREVYVHAMSAQAVVDDEKREFRFHLFNAYFESEDSAGKPQMVLPGEAIPLVIPYDIDPKKKDKPPTMTNEEIRTYIADHPGMNKNYLIGRYWAETQRRYASSFACLAFAFIGIPLGIKARRKDTSTGLMLSLLIGAAYFVCGMAGGSSKTAVLLGLWGPNVACIVLGLFLLRRARFR